MNNNLLEVKSLTQSFITPDGHNHKILDKVSLDLKEGEILAILGKSGCGKSTLLKIICQLIKPTHGSIKFKDTSEDKDFGISMVFQSFALFPWLTVFENVELGLEALAIPAEERRKKALKAIDLIGLDGFESAMPRELSGGMKQRVGFARALVVEPQILLMDEPFSALDALTSGALKNDFLDLWNSKQTRLKSVIIVTHSIEEAVLMADRVLILSSNPGQVVSELKITLPRPRNVQSAEFHTMVDQIYMRIQDSRAIFNKKVKNIKKANLAQNLLLTSPNQLAAIASMLASEPYNGSGSLADLVKTLNIKTFDALHISEDLEILKFAVIENKDIKLSKAGILFAKSDLNERKKIFAKTLLAHVPLIAYIVQILQERPDHKASKARFQTYLEDYLSRELATEAIKSIIALGRYAEVFSYDSNKQIFGLDNPA